MYVNIVFICKRVYFLTVGHQCELVQMITFDSPPTARSCFSERLLVGSHPKTLLFDLQLKDTGIREDPISITTVR